MLCEFSFFRKHICVCLKLSKWKRFLVFCALKASLALYQARYVQWCISSIKSLSDQLCLFLEDMILHSILCCKRFDHLINSLFESQYDQKRSVSHSKLLSIFKKLCCWNLSRKYISFFEIEYWPFDLSYNLTLKEISFDDYLN